uniref:uncharacterized protein LOC105352122 n=1 Tax=Fragaria vesca subsp. vesca TaxID=101020 RepID=UPI0005C91C06|nr:PREDICTED: uncharacterized protein LOC105352122 [Fragaria vesca subsp. vesca]
MSERKRARASSPSSPLATVDDIQRRLRRPSSASSPPPISTFSSPPEDRRAQIQKHSSESKLRTTNYKLEDYLDLNLLAEVSSKIGRRKKGETTSLKREVGDFEWPINELKVLVVESDKGAVSLNDDVDLSEEFGDGDVESCTAFGRFERSALRRFRR